MIRLNTLVAVAIAPVGVGDELSKHVAEVVKVIRESGLPNKTTSMFTEIEGDWDSVMAVVKRATFVLAEKGIRTEVVLKGDIRPGFTGMMEGKIDRLNDALNDKPQHAAQVPKPEVKPPSVEARLRETIGRFGGRR